MLRPNLAQDAPPTELSIGGAAYSINVDFRVWVDVLHDLRDLISAPDTLEQAMHNAEVIKNVEIAVFGKMIEAPANAVLDAISTFAAGYPEPPITSLGDGMRNYDFYWDINAIVLAIMNQYGIDLSYRRTEPFHWWEFLLCFRTLTNEHYISRLMEIRGYTGRHEDPKQTAQRYALPRETTAEDQAILDAFDALFYNA